MRTVVVALFLPPEVECGTVNDCEYFVIVCGAVDFWFSTLPQQPMR